MGSIRSYFKCLKWRSLIIAFSAILIGLLFILTPQTSADVICYVAGILLLASGIAAVVSYLASGRLFGSYALVSGIVLLVCGVFCLLRPEVTEHLKTADAILHGGDINRQSIVDELRQYAPLYIVRGNNDKDWAEAIPHDLTVTLGGVTFFMVHNRKEVPADLAGVDAVVFGHSHKYVQEEKGGVLWLNPGSCGPRRFHQEITMMTAEAEDGKIRVEKVIIPHGTA